MVLALLLIILVVIVLAVVVGVRKRKRGKQKERPQQERDNNATSSYYEFDDEEAENEVSLEKAKQAKICIVFTQRTNRWRYQNIMKSPALSLIQPQLIIHGGSISTTMMCIGGLQRESLIGQEQVNGVDGNKMGRGREEMGVQEDFMKSFQPEDKTMHFPAR